MRAALANSRFEFPARRITVNLAPAELPKESGRFDLPIALGVLASSGQIPTPQSDVLVLGELSLDGTLNAIRGVLPIAVALLLWRQLLNNQFGYVNYFLKDILGFTDEDRVERRLGEPRRLSFFHVILG